MKTIKRNDKGPAVQDVQQRLRTLGYDLNVDGVYLDRTQIAVSEFRKREAHLFLTRFGFRFDCDLNNGIGEFHLFENDRMIFVAKRVARRSFFKTYERNDFARANFFYFFSVVSVHT